MRQTIGHLLFLIVAAITITATARADVVYEVIPYGVPAGWTIDESTITTDGTLGSITDANITAYSIVFTSPTGTYEFTDSNSFTLYFESGDQLAQLMASANELTFVSSADSNQSDQLLFVSGPTAADPYVGISGAAFGSAAFIQLGDSQSVVEHVRPSVSRMFTFARVAMVPEPNSVLLLLALCGGHAILARRRSNIGQASAGR